MKKSVTVMFITALSMSTFAMAETAPAPATAASATGTTSANVEAVAAQPSALDNLQLSFANTTYGTYVSAPGNFGEAGRNDLGFMENSAVVKYKLSKELAVGTTWTWATHLAGDKATTMYDPYLRISHSALISAGAFNMSGELRWYLPVSDASDAARRLSSFRATFIPGYEIPNSPVTVSLPFYIRQDIYKRIGLIEKPTRGTAVYIGPEVDVKLSDTTTFVSLYEVEYRRGHATSLGLVDYVNSGADIQTGISWDITPTFNFNPFVMIDTARTADDVALEDATSINANITWRLL